MKQKLSTGLALLVLGALFGIYGATGDASTLPLYYVDSDAPGANNGTSWFNAFTSIQDAIDAAAGGGEIWVAEGTYHESIFLNSDTQLYGGFAGSETLLSERDWVANVTVIDASTAGGGGGAAYHVVIMFSIANARLDGFTTSGGVADASSYPNNSGGGIFCAGIDATNTIANCTISANSAGYYGGGLYFDSSSSPTLMNCTISGNICYNYGGGLYCESSSSPTLTDCTVSGNSGGGIYCATDSSPILTDCTVSGNSSSGIFCQSSSPTLTDCTVSGNSGTGIYCQSSSPTLMNCVVSGNTDYYGGGLYCSYSSPTLTNCVVGDNDAVYGGGLNCYYSSPTLTNCTVSGNSAEDTGGGLYCYDSSPTLTNCVVSGNSAEDDGGGLYCSYSSPILTNCTVSGNSAEYYGGGLFCNSSSPTLTNCVLHDNTNYAIYEYDPASDPLVMHCLFHGNPDGDWLNEGLVPKNGAAAINTLPEAEDCVDGDPLFQMESAHAISGVWTVAASYNAVTNRTLLTDAAGSFVPGALAGRLLNCDTSQHRQAFVFANSETAIEVMGNVTGYVLEGESYAVVDYHIMFGSGAEGMGTGTDAPAADFDGEGRPQAFFFDIGADEFLDSDGDNLSDWFEKCYDGDPRSYDPYPGGGDLDYNKGDTDGDGWLDGDEIDGGGDPTDSTSIPTTLWVDFAYTGVEIGSRAQPFNTLAEGVSHVPVGGTVRLKGDTAVNTTAEAPRIDKVLRIEAINGSVRIGTL